MGTLPQMLKFNGTMWSLGIGLLLAGLLGGCTKPLVNVEVNVDTCQAGAMGRSIEEPPAPGACNLSPILTAPTDANRYNNAWDMVSNTKITDHTHMCNAGGTNRTCSSNPGSQLCGGTYKLCITKWNNGACSCGCPP